MELDKSSKDLIRNQNCTLVEIIKMITDAGPHFEKCMGKIYLINSINDGTEYARFIGLLRYRIGIIEQLQVNENKLFSVSTENFKWYTRRGDSFGEHADDLLYIEITEQGWEYIKDLIPKSTPDPMLVEKGDRLKSYINRHWDRIKKIGLFTIIGFILALTPDSYGVKIIQIINSWTAP